MKHKIMKVLNTYILLIGICFISSCEAQEKEYSLKDFRCEYIEQYVIFRYAEIPNSISEPSNEDICISRKTVSADDIKILSKILREEGNRVFIVEDSLLFVPKSQGASTNDMLMLNNKLNNVKSEE